MAIQVANAPCSWGVLEFDLQGEKKGYQQVLDEMRQAGYDGTEYGDWGFMPSDPDDLRNELNKRELTLLAAFVPVALVDNNATPGGIEQAVRTAKVLSAVAESPFIVLADNNGSVAGRTKNAGRITPDLMLSNDEWKTFAQNADRVADAVFGETGVRTVFHHHCAGYVETPQEVETLLDQTDPKKLGLCFDTGHYAFGGGDPLQALDDLKDRIWHVHFKDCHPQTAKESAQNGWDYFESVQHGVFCELGKGNVDFPTVLERLRAMQYDGWIVVEQDVLPGMGSPLDSATRNREYLRSIGL